MDPTNDNGTGDSNTADAISAIDEALGIAGDGAASDGAGGSPAAGDAEGAADEGGEGEGTEAGGEGEHGEGAEGDGKDGGEGEGEGKPGQEADGKPGEKSGEKPGEQKKPDPINDPIPKDLSQETQQRIRSLIKTTKESTTRAEQAEGNFQTFINGLQASGVTPAQYQETLSFFALFNSRDPQQQKQALDLIEGMAEQLSTILGVERQVKDPLADFPELANDVQQGKITRQYAVQLARQQQSTKLRQQLQSDAARGQQTQEQQQQERAQAKADLTALEQRLSRDPRFQEKRKILVPAMRSVFQRIPPSQWAATFEQAYKELRLPAAPAGGQRQGQIPRNQPLRGGQPAGGGKKAPASMLEAISAGIDQANSR